MPLSFFTATRTGEIQSRLANDVGGVQTVVTSTASSILANVVTVASSLVAMTVLSWELTAVSLVLVPLFVLLTYRVGRLRRAVTAETQESMETGVAAVLKPVPGRSVAKTRWGESKRAARPD